MQQLKYDEDLIKKLPDEVVSPYCGVGNLFSLGEVHQGERVLDVGSGAGVNSIIAGLMVGPNGSVDGVDIIPEIIARAEKDLNLTMLDNVKFNTITGKTLPFSDRVFEVVISNGVINLIPEKETSMKEIFRVRKPEGRLLLADQVAAGSTKTDMKARLANLFQWEGGTIPGRDLLALMEKTGFQQVELVGETGFNSTPETKGILVRAKKSA